MTEANSVSISRTGDTLVVIAPHSEEFSTRASELHGKWNGLAWVFRADQAAVVEALCLELFEVVEFGQAPDYEEDISDEDYELEAGTQINGEVTVPSIDMDMDGDLDESTAVTMVEGGTEGSESNPVRKVLREVSDTTSRDTSPMRTAVQNQDRKARRRASMEEEIARLRARLRTLETRLAELDESDPLVPDDFD